MIVDEIKERIASGKSLSQAQLTYIKNNPSKFSGFKASQRAQITKFNSTQKKPTKATGKTSKAVPTKKRGYAQKVTKSRNTVEAPKPVLKLPPKITPKPIKKPIIKLPPPIKKPVIKLPTKPIIKLPTKPIKIKK